MQSSPRRSRVCALCLQSYGSGLRDHVAASDVLRARRMLTDRHAAGDPALQRGMDMFLDELTDKRPSDANKQSTRLTVCAFCTQFLPPVYQEDKLVDDLRYQILGNSTPAHGHTTKSRVVLVTGGNSGVGYHACLELAKRSNMHIILVGYNIERVTTAVHQVQAVAVPTSSVEAGVLDLNSLKAIQEFAEQLLARNLLIDTMLYNASVHMPERKLTADALEATFGVNHLGHFLLVKLLRESTRRIVIISSLVQDSTAKTSAPPPNVSNLEQLWL
ncbi:hypothetical protein Poli38472_004702 [Pythium oligandrum]|uniref:Protochlorophyllide reductase n=1 Tax=Pythium oligandrum TaxID=41045 RepID=A0A8K1CBI9_PYTOL|nr:hypothetical protein Poli38472_004702 [Pythium oligandrum]|eukprot:TMW59633.1 hypothetical protein Poli38472_004702 [Pythium oligandrum]